jgi:putative ABC transport system ATP-binding protein
LIAWADVCALDVAELTCESGRLHILSGFATADEGSVRWGDLELSTLSEADRDAWQRQHIGFVFRTFHLI